MIKILKNGAIQGTFLDISDRVLAPFGTEQGLLSVAFPPGFGAGKDYFYVYYTNKTGDNQVSRFYLSPDPNLADPNREELILFLDHPNRENEHNGGSLAFGQDGYLYIGVGDGGHETADKARDPQVLLGKLLRIDVEFESPTGDHLIYLPLNFKNLIGIPQTHPYTIPPDNPFIDIPGYREEIWALGLRNPWRISFDRQTNDLYMGARRRRQHRREPPRRHAAASVETDQGRRQPGRGAAPLAQLEAQQREMMTRLKSQQAVAAPKPSDPTPPAPLAPPNVSGLDLASSAMAVARLEGQIAKAIYYIGRLLTG